MTSTQPYRGMFGYKEVPNLANIQRYSEVYLFCRKHLAKLPNLNPKTTDLSKG
jgi:hypothetical protein